MEINFEDLNFRALKGVLWKAKMILVSFNFVAYYT